MSWERACRLHAEDLMRVYAPHLLHVPAPAPARPAAPKHPAVSIDHILPTLDVDRRAALEGLTASGRVRDLVFEVCKEHSTTWRGIIASNRVPGALAARVALYRGLRDFGWSLPQIGRFVGRDHSTICNALGQRHRRRAA